MPATIVDLPTTLPAKCASCSSPYAQDGRKYVDMHIDVLRYGRIYICTLCFNEIAVALGYQSGEVIHLQSDILFARAKRIVELEDECRNLRTALASLDFLGTLDSRNEIHTEVYSTTSPGEGSTTEHFGGGSQEPDIHTATPERTTSVRKSGSAKSSEGSGSDGLPAALKIDL